MGDAWVHDILSGRRRGIGPSLLRGGLRCAEPFYSGAMIARNTLFSARVLPSHALPVPVISVGNITAGGTGKTPVVLWLAKRLRDAGLRPAILLRGYKRNRSQISDEEEMLRQALNDRPTYPPGPGGTGCEQPVSSNAAASTPVIVHAQPDRVAGAKHVLKNHPDTTVFILDDGFQHRRLRRNFDLVLIDALNPFGYGHVHPRGLLREPLRSLRRADAFILTRTDQVPKDQRQRISDTLRMHNPTAPLYEARHTHTGLKSADNTHFPLDHLKDKRFFTFAGIANPLALEQQLPRLPGHPVGHLWFPDHHPYTESDLATLRDKAGTTNADLLLTTEKDRPKLARLPSATRDSPAIWCLAMEIQFANQGETGLLQLIRARIDTQPGSPPASRPPS